MVPPIRLDPLPRIVTGTSSALESGSSSFSLARRQLLQSACSWKRIDLRASRGEICGYGVGQGQIDIVAAQQNVFADGDAIELQLAVAVR